MLVSPSHKVLDLSFTTPKSDAVPYQLGYQTSSIYELINYIHVDDEGK